MRAVRSVTDSQLIAMRFQLSEFQTWIETRGRIDWISASQNRMGVEFVGLPEEARNQISQWIPLKLHPAESVEGNPINGILPTSKPSSPIVVPEREKSRHVRGHQRRNSIASDPTEVLLNNQARTRSRKSAF